MSISRKDSPQRQWRALPFIFIFSVVMSALCIYSSVITHTGLRELCMKLAEVTGGSASSYTINVATLAYERRIRGVYQATRLTIASAWLHTLCWVMSSLLVMARVLLAVDFTLVTVKAQLVGDVDKMLQKYEHQIHSISPDSPRLYGDDSEVELYATNTAKNLKPHIQFQIAASGNSEFALVPEETHRLYIQQLLSDLLDNITKRASSMLQSTAGIMNVSSEKAKANPDEVMNPSDPTKEFIDVDKITQDVMQNFKGKLSQGINEFENQMKSNIKSKIDKPNADRMHISGESVDEEPLKYDKKSEEENTEENEQLDKRTEKSMVTPSDSDRTLTPSYVKLNENEIADKNNQIKQKSDDHLDDIDEGRELYILDDKIDTVNVVSENEIKDSVSELTLTTFYDKILEENKETKTTEKELEKKDGTNETDRSKDLDIVVSNESTKTLTPENESIDEGLKESKEGVKKFEEKTTEIYIPKEKDDDQDSKAKAELSKVEEKKKDDEDTKDDKDKGL